MIRTLTYNDLTISVNEFGAELVSLKKDGAEYLYDGNPKYWHEQSPILFPICGRLYQNSYTFDGKRYEMTIHGIAKHNHFTVSNATENSISFTLLANENTLSSYPFDFEFTVTYTIVNSTLKVSFFVKNNDKKDMYFTLGGHPGFKVPIKNQGDFTDYYLEFKTETPAKKLFISPTALPVNKDPLYKNGILKKIPLEHSVFDNDDMFFVDSAKEVSLKSDKHPSSIPVNFENFNYIGFWQATKTDADYVCIEPWLGSPSNDAPVELTTKKDMIKLSFNETYENSYTITLK